MCSPSRLRQLCTWLGVAAADHHHTQPRHSCGSLFKPDPFCLVSALEKCVQSNPCQSTFRNYHLLQWVSLTPLFIKSIILIFDVQKWIAIIYIPCGAWACSAYGCSYASLLRVFAWAWQNSVTAWWCWNNCVHTRDFSALTSDLTAENVK